MEKRRTKLVIAMEYLRTRAGQEVHHHEISRVLRIGSVSSTLGAAIRRDEPHLIRTRPGFYAWRSD